MNIFVYSDESGVFDVDHNQIYVFAGVIYLSETERDIATRKYVNVENVIYNITHIRKTTELKASLLSNKLKDKIRRSLNNTYKFAVIIKQDKVEKRIFASKYDKQRYLDFAYKIGLKRFFQELIKTGKINPDEVENLYVYVDEHTTATNGRYELQKTLEKEFKKGMLNYEYNVFHKPIFTKIKKVEVIFCNSQSTTLIRAADIISNNVFYKAKNGLAIDIPNMVATYMPNDMTICTKGIKTT